MLFEVRISLNAGIVARHGTSFGRHGYFPVSDTRVRAIFSRKWHVSTDTPFDTGRVGHGIMQEGCLLRLARANGMHMRTATMQFDFCLARQSNKQVVSSRHM